MSQDVLAIRRAAMDVLARRDHSGLELQQKLQNRFPDKTAIQRVIHQLQQDGLQSDRRFAGHFIRWRAGRGYGEAKIRLELMQKGVADADITEAFAENAIDWLALLQQQYVKKYGNYLPEDMAQKARCSRFLLGRGFSYSELNQLWRSLPL